MTLLLVVVFFLLAELVVFGFFARVEHAFFVLAILIRDRQRIDRRLVTRSVRHHRRCGLRGLRGHFAR